ncbi:hypothetical protein ERJ75_001738600 [Trypanosoma vivax]|uniref:Uncharacterized protein n=1 Tax=Trypanosoma vivax (strain Y486) TaxID=1055687 RepID=G0U2Z7_TRYVY|nr:hypothetical protein TRVL_02695 [Trypanosoma vivax]KAH8604133.1 hypothetical protein ERJ75_001738600 [Trypanosoma vivax]CCC50652.1 conserved hypothetical protein [Trypanosoma vivax Y486]
MVGLIGKLKELGTSGALTAVSLALAVVLFVAWCTATTNIIRMFPSSVLKEPSLAVEAMRIISFHGAWQRMGMVHFACFALMILLVVLVALIEGALVDIKHHIESRAKLPPLSLVQHINNDYHEALSRSGVASRQKQLR